MNWKALCITPHHSLLDALAVINAGGHKLALVTQDIGKLMGMVTDGDIRRALLRGFALQTNVEKVMITNPLTVRASDGRGAALLRMLRHQLSYAPVLDNQGLLCDLWSVDELQHVTILPNPVVIMAGGLGTRLAPLTDDTPKPMLPVGGQPLLEVILQNFLSQGFREFYLAVNYKAATIMDYFGDGSSMGASITYLHEHDRMGTAGALSLMPRPEVPCIVMNGDILTRLNFGDLLKTHKMRDTPATMVVKRHAMQIPYGVVSQDHQGYMQAIEEKPQHSFAVSAGINVLSPEVFDLLPPETFLDMPDLYKMLLHQELQPAVYEMTEYWLDIGQINDYRRANEEFDLYRQLTLR